MANQTELNKIAESLRAQKHGLFSERNSVEEVLEYARSGTEPTHAITAAIMMHNTLLEQLAASIEVLPNDEKT